MIPGFRVHNVGFMLLDTAPSEKKKLRGRGTAMREKGQGKDGGMSKGRDGTVLRSMMSHMSLAVCG